MYEEQRWCTDVLDQIAAVRSALDGTLSLWSKTTSPDA
jgi:DNA-binding FrmR family transcriptional regulator